jgi:tetratricopeptide (TPR) repeat protein
MDTAIIPLGNGHVMDDKAARRLSEAFAALQLGLGDRAEQLLRGVLRKTPRNFDALIALGAVRGEQGRFDDAAALFERAAKVRPDNADAHYNLGVALAHLGSNERALDCYRNALHAQPRHLNACNNLAAALIARDRAAEALACIEQGLAHHPLDTQLQSKRGAALRDLDRIDEAVDSFRQVARREPNDPLGHANLGLALKEAGRLDEAIERLEHAVSLDPHRASHHNHLGVALADAGRLDAALACLRRAVTLDPGAPELRENLGLTLLLNGNLQAGWPEYEFRHRLERFKARRPVDVPVWQGEPLTNKSILAYAEQGFGDTIQFVRYLPLLVGRGAAVTLAVQPRLMALLSCMADLVTIVPLGDVRARFDFQCALLSLPHKFGTTLSSIPTDRPYLSADPALVARWRERIGHTGFKIGIAWQGSTDYAGDRGRSLALREFAPLAAIPGVRLISLQKGFGVEQIAAVDFSVETLDESFDASGAFVDTAALMMSLDLVVTSDTSIPHLAGALGRPVFIALRRVPDWRWLLDRDDSPWYPTARLFRQRAIGDWADVFERIAAEVRRMALPLEAVSALSDRNS